MIKEIYIKGTYEYGVGAAAFVIVGNDQRLTYGGMQFGEHFEVGGKTFKCDPVSLEILAAICGVARCSNDINVNIYSDNQDFIHWVRTAEEPMARESLMNIYRTMVGRRDVLVTETPTLLNGIGYNQWRNECEMLVQQILHKKIANQY